MDKHALQSVIANNIAKLVNKLNSMHPYACACVYTCTSVCVVVESKPSICNVKQANQSTNRTLTVHMYCCCCPLYMDNFPLEKSWCDIWWESIGFSPKASLINIILTMELENARWWKKVHVKGHKPPNPQASDTICITRRSRINKPKTWKHISASFRKSTSYSLTSTKL